MCLQNIDIYLQDSMMPLPRRPTPEISSSLKSQISYLSLMLLNSLPQEDVCVFDVAFCVCRCALAVYDSMDCVPKN